MTKTALVTGGSRNIGQGIAITLARHGYDTAITYAGNREGALTTQAQIESIGRRCFIYEAHLENPDAPARAVHAAYKDLGRLDVMVCNAGKDGRGSILSATADEMDFLYTNSLRNYYLCVGAAARLMVRDKVHGSIIMITSVRASLPHAEDFMYGGIKAAMERACKSMAMDLSEFNIRVNCVAPGAVWTKNLDTPFVRESIPLHRSGTPEDVGEAVAYLAGPQSAYVTGTTLLVDGGLSLPSLLEQENAIPWKYERWVKARYEKAMELLEKEEAYEEIIRP
jgi:NAD(P)-dependent dehydrogenase (short-subunit alcohol dehydrogenase family)